VSIEMGLLADIIDNPDDDVPRRIYADWLEDNGQPERAEFIRLVLDLAAMAADSPALARMKLRCKTLYHEHHKDWSRDIDRLVRHRTYKRGMIEWVHLTGWQYVAGAGEMSARAPIREVSLCNPVGVRELASLSHLRRVKSLDLEKCDITSEALLSLAGSPHLGSLESLAFGRWRITLSAIHSLLDSPALPRLKRLSLTGIALNQGDLARLFAGPRPALRSLELCGVWLPNAGARELARSPQVARLESLTLRRVVLQEAGSRALAQSPHLTALQRLDVRGTRLSSAVRDLLRERFGDRVLLE